MINVRAFEEKDWDAVWAVIEPVLRAGETHTASIDITQEEAFISWVTTQLATFVATDAEGLILGTYNMKPTSRGRAHMSAIVDTLFRQMGEARAWGQEWASTPRGMLRNIEDKKV